MVGFADTESSDGCQFEPPHKGIWIRFMEDDGVFQCLLVTTAIYPESKTAQLCKLVARKHKWEGAVVLLADVLQVSDWPLCKKTGTQGQSLV